MSGGGFRVSISSSMREVIQNIKEVTGDHTEEEIYAMLKDCAMDPNETVQKLLMQGILSFSFSFIRLSFPPFSFDL